MKSADTTYLSNIFLVWWSDLFIFTFMDVVVLIHYFYRFFYFSKLKNDLYRSFNSFIKEFVREPNDGVSLLLDLLKVS